MTTDSLLEKVVVKPDEAGSKSGEEAGAAPALAVVKNKKGSLKIGGKKSKESLRLTARSLTTIPARSVS